MCCDVTRFLLVLSCKQKKLYRSVINSSLEEQAFLITVNSYGVTAPYEYLFGS